MSDVLGTVGGLPPNGLTGAAAGDQFGAGVAEAGDVNGDGFPDVIVGAPYNDVAGTNAGRAYLYFGGPSMHNSPDVTLTGLVASDVFGFSVAGAGDVNGDGYADVIVGAYGNDAAGSNAGAAYVFFGGPTMDAVADVTVAGQSAGDFFGYAVSGAGDVDGDGFDDVIVGALGNDIGGVDRGRAYLYLGGASMNAAVDVILRGTAAGDQFGYSVAGIGDVNSDGYADVIVGSPNNDVRGADAGKATVYFGGASMDILPDVTLLGAAVGDLFGYAVAGAGDVNGDGVADMVVGALLNDVGGSNAGQATIYFGGGTVDNVADVTLTGVAANDNFGLSVAGAGDVDGDGFDEVLAAAPRYDTNRGRVSVLSVDLTGEDLPDEFFTGAAAGDYFGYSMSGAGDVNGDGYDDMIVGAYGTNGSRGTAYIFYGGGGGIDSLPDVVLSGAIAGDSFGYSVSGAGDVNGDGFDDVIVGSPYNDATGTDAGRAYIYFGGAPMNTGVDVTLTGAAASDFFGVSVSGAGDVNGDGYADVIVGAHGNDGGGTDAGRANVYLGGASMDSVADVTLTGAAASDFFGVSVSGAGDVNGDGYADVIVGAYANDAAGSDAGRAYVYFGGASMNAVAEVTLTGAAAYDFFGFSVSGAGDVDGDGSVDLIVGAFNNDAGGGSAGRAYLYRSSFPAVAPRIAAVRDVPDDQGGVVTVEWTRSAYDGEGDSRVREYAVERSRSAGTAAWEQVAVMPVSENNVYSAVVPTYGVPAEGTSTPVRIRITARTAQSSQYWRSTVATGASIDNIPPPAPLSLTAASVGAGTQLSWAAPQAPDLAGYAVYRSDTAGFTPDSTALVATVDGLSWTDGSGAGFYRVAARDANGNESAPSAEASVLATATEADGLPTDFALAAPAPNPSRGEADIRFDLPAASRVRLTVFDVQGREVARLVDADRAAGTYRVSVGAAGLAAGTYVVRMEAGSFATTRFLSVVR